MSRTVLFLPCLLSLTTIGLDQQRQNLNEVENLYFHHSHLRTVRQGHQAHGTGTVAQSHHAPVANLGPTPVLPDTSIPSGVTDQPLGLSNDGPECTSPPPEHATNADAQSSSPSLLAPIPAAFGSSTTMTSMNRPPSAFDLADPHILARLAQLQAQIQMPAPRQSSSTISPASQPVPASVPFPGLAAFPPHIQSPQPPNHPHPLVAIPFSTYPPPFVGTPTPGSAPLYIPASTSAPQNPTLGASPSLVPVATSSTALIPTSQTSIAPSALTYDSFWSTHASSTGPTRALYRTHTGFTASATPTGNVAMLTPGGNAAIMTADGVYVGGATSRSA